MNRSERPGDGAGEVSIVRGAGMQASYGWITGWIHEGLLAAASHCRRDPITLERLRDTARDLGAGATMRLHFGCREVRCAGDRAGFATLVVDADFALDVGGVEGVPDYCGDECDSDRDADCGACHEERAVS